MSKNKPIRTELRVTDTERWAKLKEICDSQGRSINVTLNMLMANYVDSPDHSLSFPPAK